MNQYLVTRRAFFRRAAQGLGLAALVGIAAPAVRAAQTARQLSPAEAAEVGRVETYLNGIRTLKSRFAQIADNGEISEGTFYLSRPGRLRLEYDPPNPNLLVANGTFLIHYDSSLKTSAYLPLSSTPAGVLVRERIAFTGDIAVTAVDKGPAALRVTLVQADDVRAGRLSLIFSERPFQLIKWQVVDGQGRVTELALLAPQVNIALDPALFRFDDPNNVTDPTSRTR